MKKWKRFEYLAAALHKLECSGAIVKINDSINGREFDVTIRIKNGPYKYLTVIECKDHKGKIPVSLVESFVTKAQMASANKAVLISRSGYQRGCGAVAERFGLELLILDEECTEVPLGNLLPAFQITDVTLNLKDSISFKLPDSYGSLKYYVKHSIFDFPEGKLSIDEVITSAISQVDSNSLIDKDVWRTKFKGIIDCEVPHQGKYKCDSVTFRMAMVDCVTFTGPPWDSRIFHNYNTQVSLTDVEGNSIVKRCYSELELGINTKFDKGSFYFSPHLEQFYYCNNLNDSNVELILVQGFQHGHLIQAKFTAPKSTSKYYVLVMDKAKLEELKYFLDRYLKDL